MNYGKIVLVVSLVAILAIVGMVAALLRISDKVHMISGFADIERANSFHLVLMSAAGSRGDVETVTLLTICSQARFQIDRQVYPPKKQGGDSPGVVMGALSAVMGGPILESIKYDPATYLAVHQRLTEWHPKFPANYDPGWEYSQEVAPDRRQEIVDEVRSALLDAMSSHAKLCADPEAAGALVAYAEVDREIKAQPHYSKAFTDQEHEDWRKRVTGLGAERRRITWRLTESKWRVVPESRWHSRVSWNAEDYFTDPAVIALCEAIERDDVPAMEACIRAGADPSAVGKDGMTPLLWAIPDRRMDRFQCLLRHGADPSVPMQSSFDASMSPLWPTFLNAWWELQDQGISCREGVTVAQLVCFAPIEYLELLLKYGMDPNEDFGEHRPLSLILSRSGTLSREDSQRVKLLLEKGADPNLADGRGAYPLVDAISNHQYAAATLLLDGGADPRDYPAEQQKAFSSHYRRQQEVFAKARERDPRLPHDSRERVEGFEEIERWMRDQGVEDGFD